MAVTTTAEKNFPSYTDQGNFGHFSEIHYRSEAGNLKFCSIWPHTIHK